MSTSLAPSPGSLSQAHPKPRQSERRREQILFARYRDCADIGARDELIARALPLARHLARRYQHGSESLEDLQQVAALAVVKAVDRFEPSRGFEFSTYAVPTILGELKRHLRDTSWAVHLPRSMQERVLEIRKTSDKLQSELGRSPTPTELAQRLGTTSEHVLETLDAAAAYETASLDTPLNRDEDTGTFADLIGETDTRLDIVEHRGALQRGLRSLPERERLILQLRFVKGLTQVEIAREVGISQMHVSRLTRRSLEALALFTDADRRQTLSPSGTKAA